jgi:hypothetical protein
MQPLYTNPANEYELKGNGLAQCMERTTVFGWRCYSWVLLMLLTALAGVSVALGVVATEPKSKCFGKQIRSPGTYDPTKYCLAWSPDGLTAMADGTCPNECDQELYESHITSSERRLTESSAGGDIDSFCTNLCIDDVHKYYHYGDAGFLDVYDSCITACKSTPDCSTNQGVNTVGEYNQDGCAFAKAYSVCFSQSNTTSNCQSICDFFVPYFNELYSNDVTDTTTCTSCCENGGGDDTSICSNGYASSRVIYMRTNFKYCRRTEPSSPLPSQPALTGPAVSSR